MKPDPTVIAALETAVGADPSNTALRLHLAQMLLQADEPARALEQAAAILASQPAHFEALRIAAETAEQTGDSVKAKGYRRLYEALGLESAKTMLAGVDSAFDDVEEEVLAAHGQGSEYSHAFHIHDQDFQLERPPVTLSDVAGMIEVKKRLELAFLGPMRNPDLRKLYGKSLKGGLLMYGPPGCGKTHIARAVAGELAANFIAIELTDIIDMWIGQSEKNLHELFNYARRNSPCVIFIDELDALGHKRTHMRGLAGRNTINQLLSELDGAKNDNEGLFILAASNHPWDIDTALRRPGRLDRTLLVVPPDQPARAAIFRMNLEARPLDKGISFTDLAKKTEDYSGADIAHVCESAAELALGRSIESGELSPITPKDVAQAMKEVKPSIRSWFDTAKNHAIFANEGGVYDDLVAYMKARKML